MDVAFTPAELRFQDRVRAFLAANLCEDLRRGAAATTGVFAEPDIGREWQRRLHAAGMLASHWPAADGGTGWSPTERYIFERECALAGAPVLATLGLKLVGPVICRFGTADQKARFLPRILSGEDYWCQGYSEPGAGSDLAAVSTRAVRDHERYRIDGAKTWTTHAQFANWIFMLVRTDTTAKKQAGLSFLLVPMDQPGVSVSPIVTLAGDREVNSVFFDGAVTGAENLVGREGDGWTIAKFLLENERGGSCHAPKLLADIDALARRAAVRPCESAEHRANLTAIGRLRLEAEALEFTELRILSDLAHGRTFGPKTSLTKLVASEIRQRIDQLAFEMAGYDGLQLPSERPLYGDQAPPPVGDRSAQLAAAVYLNGRAWTIFGGTSEVQRTIIARSLLAG